MDISKIQINNVNYNLKDASAIASCTYDSFSQKIVFKNKDNVVICQIDATPFIVDGMVSNVAVSNGNLVITFNTDAGKSPISIPLTDIFNPSEYYTKIGYFVCDTAANTAAKTISAAGFVLSTGGSIKIKMTNGNTVNNATLDINSTGAKPLYYAGLRASSANTWESGETIDVYYDGTNYMANNVVGSSSDGVFDVSAKTGDTYESLNAALTAMIALPAAYKKGGMSIKFVLSFDNNYVQFRYMGSSTAVADFTNVANWQGVDDEPTAGSNNLVESGGVTERKVSFSKMFHGVYLFNNYNVGDYYTENYGSTELRRSLKFKVYKDEVIYLKTYISSQTAGAARALCIVNNASTITYITPAENVGNYLNNPLIVKVLADGYAYIECDPAYEQDFNCVISKFIYLDDYVVPGFLKVLYGKNCTNLNLHYTGDYIKTGDKGAVADTIPTESNRNGYVKQSCSEGDCFLVFAHSGNAARAYAFCDSNNIVLESAAALEYFCGFVVAPANSAYVVFSHYYDTSEVVNRINDFTPPIVYKTDGVFSSFALIEDVETIKEDIAALKEDVELLNDMDDIKLPVFVSESSGKYVDEDGNEQSSSDSRRIAYFDLPASILGNIYTLKFNSPGSAARGITLYDDLGNVLYKGQMGQSTPTSIVVVTESFPIVVGATKLKVSYIYDGNPYEMSLSKKYKDPLPIFISENSSKYVDKDGVEQTSSVDNRRVALFDLPPLMHGNTYSIKYNSGGSASCGITLYNALGDMIFKGLMGKSTPSTNVALTEKFKVIDGAVKLKLSYIDNGNPYEIALVEKYSNPLEFTNIPNIVFEEKKAWLDGASICSEMNGFFQVAMEKLGITGTLTALPSSNIFHAAYLLYTDGATYAENDVMILSHTHNYDVYTLPDNLINYTADDYEADTELSPYITDSTKYMRYITEPSSNYTNNQLYAIGYDYVIKKWYKLRETLGKSPQIILYTYWHDAHTVYNDAIRKLAVKWGIPLIKDDENIGFSKNVLDPVTGQQPSVKYGDTTGFVPTETINGVVYAIHPARVPSGLAITWANLPYIQKKRATILISSLKSCVID